MRGLSVRVAKTVNWTPPPAQDTAQSPTDEPEDGQAPPSQPSTPPYTDQVTHTRQPQRKHKKPTQKVALPVPQPNPYLKEGKLDPRTAVLLAAMRMEHGTVTQDTALKEAILSRLPELHGKQKWIAESTAKRKVVNTGRRGGKTTMAACVSAVAACQGRRVLLASTTQEQADAFWEKLCSWLSDFIEAGHIKKNETKRILIFPAFDPARGRGRIRVKTASDADTLRGDYADFLVLDECALLAPNAWREVGAPMLLDNDGDAWFLSTPRRRNWFFELYQQAKTDETGRWAAFHFTSFDNPYLSEDALAEIVTDLTDEAYRQEILAEFLEGEGAVFRNIKANMTAPTCAPVTTPSEHEGHMMVMGGDWGKINDSTAFSIICLTCKQEVYFDHFTKIEYQLQRNRIRNAFYLWKPYRVVLESNAVGNPNLEMLRNGEGTEPGIPVEGFDTNKKTKPQLIDQMVLALERETFKFLDIPRATAEFEAYEGKKSPVTGNISYSAPEGMHDDCVVARMIAVDAAMNAGIEHAPSVASYTTMPQVSYYTGYDNEDSVPAFARLEGYNQAMPAPPGKPW